MHTAPTDIELWNAFKKGDKESFGQLFRRHYPLLVQYGNKLCPDVNLLEDYIQELFLELWQTDSQAEVQFVKAYLLKSLKYKILRSHRSSKAKQTTEITDDIAFEISPENFLINRQEDQQKLLQIIGAIRQLSGRQREIIYLKFYQGLSYNEVSEVMQINYQAARNLFCEAIKSLRKILQSIVKGE